MAQNNNNKSKSATNSLIIFHVYILMLCLDLYKSRVHRQFDRGDYNIISFRTSNEHGDSNLCTQYCV